MKRTILFAIALLALALAGGCTRNDSAPLKSLGVVGSMQRPMVCDSGQCATDTSAAHDAVVFITISMAEGTASCSGTLIAPNVILTAGHCVSNESGTAITTPSSFAVYFGDSCYDCLYGYGCSCTKKTVTGVHRHPSYVANWSNGAPKNDIAILQIGSTPANITPIPILPYSMSSSIKAGISVEFVGFGVDNSGNSGVKLKATNTLAGVCNSSSGCGDYAPWTIYYDQSPGGPCSGDSGGPTFWKDSSSKEYVIADTSYGDQNCQYYGVSTFVSHFANSNGDNFLLTYVGSGYADGHSCSNDVDCSNGNCVNNVCCNTACDQACYTCSTGTCTVQNNVSCDDKNPCTLNDRCTSGVCAGTAKDCSSSGSTDCTVGGSCNLLTGACEGGGTKANGSACEDGNPCTQGDTCQSGVCQAGAAQNTCPAPDQCHQASTCNVATGACATFPTKANGTACDDGNPCTTGDSCLAGSCLPATVVACPAPDQCHEAGSCNAATGKCPSTYAAKANGTACNDGNACTSNDSCSNGVCSGTPNANACPATACHAAGTCNASTGLCSGANVADGTSCNDGDATTEKDQCTAGICKGRTIGLDPCYGEANGTDCDDGNPCTRNDACKNNVCTGTAKTCTTPPDDCHQQTGACNWETGSCVYLSAATGTACDDGNAGTIDDQCINGKCLGTNECEGQDDGATCTLGSCKGGACTASSGCGCGSAGNGAPSALLMGLFAAAILARKRQA